MATAPLFDTAPAKAPAVFPTTANKIRELLKRRFCAPEWALFFEVANGTGAMRPRYADAIAMNLWPSRGLTLHGFEIKISRSDWQSELKNPAKAEEMAKHCDFWWIVAAKGVVRPGELPPTWGLYEVDGRGVTMRVQAPQAEQPEITRVFMAALIRRAGEFDTQERRRLQEEMTREIQETAERRVEDRVKDRTRRFEELKSAVEEFERESGLEISGWKGGKEIGKAVSIINSIGVDGVYSSARSIADTARRLANTLEQELNGLSNEVAA
jgi:hypothetical protein